MPLKRAGVVTSGLTLGPTAMIEISKTPDGYGINVNVCVDW